MDHFEQFLRGRIAHYNTEFFTCETPEQECFWNGTLRAAEAILTEYLCSVKDAGGKNEYLGGRDVKKMQGRVHKPLVFSESGAYWLAGQTVEVLDIDRGEYWEPCIVKVRGVCNHRPEEAFINAKDITILNEKGEDMQNVGYCRFENTYLAMLECREGRQEELSNSENDFRRLLLKLCAEYVAEEIEEKTDALQEHPVDVLDRLTAEFIDETGNLPGKATLLDFLQWVKTKKEGAATPAPEREERLPIQQRQLHTVFHSDDSTERIHCPFCGMEIIGRYGEHDWLDAAQLCKHFCGFVQGHKSPAAMFKGVMEKEETTPHHARRIDLHIQSAYRYILRPHAFPTEGEVHIMLQNGVYPKACCDDLIIMGIDFTTGDVRVNPAYTTDEGGFWCRPSDLIEDEDS